MIEPDRWNKRCPRARECSRDELIDFMSVGTRLDDKLTQWELTFCSSGLRSMKYSELSDRQKDVLDGGLLRKLWGNDPALWR